MQTLLLQDWAGLLLAAVVLIVGWLLWRLARNLQSKWLPKWLRWPLGGIGGLVLLLGGALLIGACVHVFQLVGQSAQYPMPGEAFDVGGYKLHLMRQGENNANAQGRAPTLILVSGGYAQGLALHHLYQALAADTRTIIFDRAGAGWSERSPEPRTVANDVEDLKRLLEVAGEPGPFVLAGHSWGGLFAYQFAGLHPELTAGVVLLDATPFGMMKGEFGGSLQGYGSLMRMSAFAQLFALDGLMWSMSGVNVSDPDKDGFLFPPLKDIWPLYQAGDIRVRGGISTAESMETNIAQADDLVDDPGSLGDIPVLVIYQESIMPDYSKLSAEEQEKMRQASAKAMKMTVEEYDDFMLRAPAMVQDTLDGVVALSRNSRLIHPPKPSTHQFPYEHPEWTADRIREMLDQTRQ
jgi:pimeloyl-ACP methyl ester carboxylesterase